MGLIYLDSCVLIYAIESHPQWADGVRKRLASASAEQLAVSDLVRMECLVRPIRDADLVLQRRYEAGIDELVQLPLPQAVFVQAAHVRARFGLKPPDALHLACAQHHGCDELWTNDERLTRAGHGMVRNVLSQA